MSLPATIHVPESSSLNPLIFGLLKPPAKPLLLANARTVADQEARPIRIGIRES